MKWTTSVFFLWLTATANGQQLNGGGEEAGAPDQTNLLFILADNQPASLLGVYCNPYIRTPNIDQLAAEGTRFTGVFAVNGMCSPTRATLMTGLGGVLLYRVTDWTAALLILAMVACILVVIAILETVGRSSRADTPDNPTTHPLPASEHDESNDGGGPHA